MRVGALVLVLFSSSCGVVTASIDQVSVEDVSDQGGATLSLSTAKILQVPDSKLTLAVWENQLGEDRKESAFAIKDDGAPYGRAKRTRFELVFRGEAADPKSHPTDFSQASLYLVQFYGPALAEFVRGVEQQGATAIHPFPRNAYVMRLDADALERISNLPYVRAVEAFEARRRIDSTPGAMAQPTRYWVLPTSQAPEAKSALAAQLKTLGAEVHSETLDHYLVEATLTGEQVNRAAELAEVLHIDAVSQPEADMDKARILSGANFLEQTVGFTGQGVRAEVMDGNVDEMHPDFKNRGILFHDVHSGDASHGTCTAGIVFGDGTGNAAARGLLPSGQPIFADYEILPKKDRKTHTAELLSPQYSAVLQSNSWGSSLTTEYTTISAQMDALIFDLDFLIFNSQSNTGNRESRPEAWAKNVVSIGGVKHLDTLDTADDKWASGGSIGPAADGRLKPDLAHFWDLTLAPASGGGYRNFGGTSGATPITAGYAGLMMQMWSNGLFGNKTQGQTVFDNRPHFTTAKAILVNSATQWAFTGATHDLTRVHQGWGRVDIKKLYELRNSMLIINETELLTQSKSKSYPLTVAANTKEFHATLTWADPPAAPSAGVHRVNDLTLKVTAPDGTIYFGNNGLAAGQVSTPGGNPNTIDTLENVIVADPAAGIWTVEVRADEVAQDGHLETPEVDVDFALVVSGIQVAAENQSPTVSFTAPANNSTVSGKLALTADAKDADGQVVRVRFGLPNGSLVDVDQPPFTTELDTTQIPNGAAAFTAVAFDDKGATSEAATVNVTVDNQATCAPGTFVATGLPLAIPDNNQTGITATVPVTGKGQITSVKVSLKITHTYRGDLTIDLAGPSGTTVSLLNREGGSADDVVLTDIEVTGLTGAAAGDWKLIVRDRAGIDVGTLDTLSLVIGTDCQ